MTLGGFESMTVEDILVSPEALKEFASQNPAVFCKAAALPQLRYGPGTPDMPTLGNHSGFNHLSERPDPHRNLLIIEPVDNTSRDEIKKFKADLPQEYRPIPPCDFPNPFTTFETPSENIRDVTSAVQSTIVKGLHLVLSNLPFKWVSPPSTRSNTGVSTMLWARLNSSDDELEAPDVTEVLEVNEISEATVAVFIQEPWVLSPKDFQTFCSLPELRNYVPADPCSAFARAEVQHEWGPAQQLWAFIYDRCEEYRCHSFIVTSYEQWAFGCFSKARTHAFITRPYTDGGSKHTVMERTLHWVVSATLQSEFRDNGYVAPEGLPWMAWLYVPPEIIEEEFLMTAKRYLPEEESTLVAAHRPARRSSRRSRRAAVQEEPVFPMPPAPSELIAGIESWRHGIPALKRVRRTGSTERTELRVRTPPAPRREPSEYDSPGRLRLPPHLQSPERQRSVIQSERSGETVLDDTEGLDTMSMHVVGADAQPVWDGSVTPRGSRGPPNLSRLAADVQMTDAAPLSRRSFSAEPPNMQPRERNRPRPYGTRAKTRLVNKALRGCHLAGTISTLSDETARNI